VLKGESMDLLKKLFSRKVKSAPPPLAESFSMVKIRGTKHYPHLRYAFKLISGVKVQVDSYNYGTHTELHILARNQKITAGQLSDLVYNNYDRIVD
jgi:hypothetical protein